MNLRSSLKVMLLALVVSSVAAESCNSWCDQIFDTNNWYLLPKIGVAPSIFAGRAHQQLVVPRAGLDLVDCSVSGAGECVERDGLLNNAANVLQETCCLPKFSNMFRQGVLHVGFELGYQTCDSNCPVFFEFIYNRANGRCQNPCGDYITGLASVGCSARDCNTDCSTSRDCSKNSCGFQATTDSFSDICGLRDDYSNYSAYGAYIGARHFTDRFWCDSTSWWFGYKVGILHRKQVNSCSVLRVQSDCEGTCEEGRDITLRRAIFCKSNSVSGGVQMGFNYCYSDCLSFLLGFEVVASCGLKGNRNYPISSDLYADNNTSIFECSNVPTNILVGNTGTLVQFPIWIGFQWDFGSFCNPCDAC